MVCGKNSCNKCIEEFILFFFVLVDIVVKFLNNFWILVVREKECLCDLILVGDYCENMVMEFLVIVVSVNSVGYILKVVDCNGMLFLDVFIENE